MSLKKEYNTAKDLVLDIIGQYGIPNELVFSGIDKYNRVMFDVNIKKKQLGVSELNEIVSEANFIDRYYQSSSHLIKNK